MSLLPPPSSLEAPPEKRTHPWLLPCLYVGCRAPGLGSQLVRTFSLGSALLELSSFHRPVLAVEKVELQLATCAVLLQSFCLVLLVLRTLPYLRNVHAQEHLLIPGNCHLICGSKPEGAEFFMQHEQHDKAVHLSQTWMGDKSSAQDV